MPSGPEPKFHLEDWTQAKADSEWKAAQTLRACRPKAKLESNLIVAGEGEGQLEQVEANTFGFA